MKRIIKLSLAAAAMLAVICSGAWAANVDANANTKEWTDGNNYIVTGNVTIGDRINVKGSVTLTLNDGCKLDAKQGIDVPLGNSLTIKAGGQGGTGMLIATGAVYTAGIGGGRNGYGGDITIDGGNVTATGGDSAAGIGGGGDRLRGRGGNGGNTKIFGGTVTANGGRRAAGIGGGKDRNGGNTKIFGGNVTATGGVDAAGIGGGHMGYGGNTKIFGGTVTATGGSRAAGIGGGFLGARGYLDSGIDSSAWIVTNGVNADRSGFTSGVLFVDSDGAVYGDQTIDKNVNVPSGKTLKIEGGRKMTVPAGKTLKVNKGATLTLESGGHLVNDGTIVNDGLVRLPKGSDIKGFNIIGSGVVAIDGKAVRKEPTPQEKEAVKSIIDKIKGADSAANGIRGAEAAPMEAEVKLGDIVFDAVDIEGALVTMSINVAAGPDQYAIIANSQMVDVAPGSSTDVGMDEDDIDDEDIDDEDAYVDDAPKGKIVYVDRFIAPKSAAKTSDIELDEVSIEDAGATELDATLVVVNGKASEKVQAMPEYRPSGLVDGQGLAVFYDDEFKMNVLVVFDGDPDDGLATDLIYAKYVAEETPQKSSSGGACATGAAAFVAIAALAVMERRKK